MAKIKMAHIISEARGKIGGTVFSRNTYGAYIRTKVTPINPSSTYQQGVRTFMSECSQAWRSLSDDQRRSFNLGTVNWNNTDIFGDQNKLSGFNLFMKLNRNLLEIGEAKITTCPVPDAIVNFTSLSVVADTTGGTMDITWTPTPTPANQHVIVYMTPPISAGVDFVKSEYRKVLIWPAAVASPQNIGGMYIPRFGALPPAGEKVFVRFLPIITATGQPGTFITASAVAI